MAVIEPTEFPLVVQMWEYAQSKGLDKTKREIYELMIKYNMINPDGTPTEWALKEGLIEQ